MTANATAILKEAAVSAARLDALARETNDRQLAECVHGLSALMQAMLILLSDLPRAIGEHSSPSCGLTPKSPTA